MPDPIFADPALAVIYDEIDDGDAWSQVLAALQGTPVGARPGSFGA